MADSARIVWTGFDGLVRNINGAPDKLKRAVQLGMQRSAPMLENYMKSNAPWTDQTGNARNGLAARAYQQGDEIGILLFHQVDYGIYLETKNSGRYAIIVPTLESQTDSVMGRIGRVMDNL